MMQLPSVFERVLAAVHVIRIRIARWVLSTLAMSVLFGAEPHPIGEGVVEAHPLSVDDVLATEGIGAAQFSPDGLWLAYNLVPAYESLKDFSYWMRAYGLSGHRLWIKQLDDVSVPTLQPGLDTEATNFLIGFSPTSTHLIALEHKFGRFRLVSCLVGKDDCIWFEPMPDIRDRYIRPENWTDHVVWTSGDTFVMPVRFEGPPGSEMRNRAATGKFLWREWNKAWSGSGSTASEAVSSGKDRSTDWAEGNLAEFNIKTGKVAILVKGRFVSMGATGDGRYLLAARAAERDRPPADARPLARETHPMFDRHYELRLIDNVTRTVRECREPFNIDPGSFVWSRTGSRFAVFGWEKGQKPEEGHFYIFDRDTLKGHALNKQGLLLTNRLLDPTFKWFPGPAHAALLDKGLAVLATPENGGRTDWYLLQPDKKPLNLSAGLGAPGKDILDIERGSIAIMSGKSIYRLGDDGAPQRISADDVEIAGRAVDKADPHDARFVEFDLTEARIGSNLPRHSFLISSVSDLGVSTVKFIDFRRARDPGRSLSLGVPNAHFVAASDTAGASLVTEKDGAATRLLLVTADAPPVQLALVNAHLNAVRKPATRSLSYALRDPLGKEPPREEEGCLLLPPDYDPQQRYPILIELYPVGTGGGCRNFADAPSPAAVVPDLFASRGLIYMRPAIPLDWARTVDDPQGAVGGLLDQTIDMLVARGIADPDRIVLFGTSQGGMTSLVAATQSNKLAAIISINGWADYFSHYFGSRGLMRYFHLDQNGGDNRWRYECTGGGASHDCPFGFGTTAYAEPERYARVSPVSRAHSIIAPVLLVHSDLDYFGMDQYDEMFGALYRAGKDARYVRYWGEGHGPSSPANIRDLWNRIDAFLIDSHVTELTSSPSD